MCLSAVRTQVCCSSKRAEVQLTGRAAAHTHTHTHAPSAHGNHSTLAETPPPVTVCLGQACERVCMSVCESARFTRV